MALTSYRLSPTQGNPWGLASLVSGIVGFCPLPFLGGVLGIVFGILGMRRSNETHTGRGMSVTGLALGVVGLLLWLVIALVSHAGYRFLWGTAAQGPRGAADAFVRDLSSGNLTAAGGRSDGLSEGDLKTLSVMLQSHGAVKEVSASGFSSADGVLQGTITFEKAKANYTARLSWNEGNGWVIRSLMLSQ